MLIKRKFVESSLSKWREKYGHLHPAARPVDVKPEVSHVELDHITQLWRVTQNVIDNGVQEGWLTFGKGRVTLTTDAELPDVVYKIVSWPGYYCCHCGERIETDERGREAREHMQQRHYHVPSPDPQNPSGWRKDNFYACELESGAVAKLSGRAPATVGLLRRLIQGISNG